MRTTNSALKRIIVGGFALATATALVIPGIATAEEAPDTGSMDLIQGLLGGSSGDETGEKAAEETTETSPLASLQTLFGGSADDTTETVKPAKVNAEEGAETDPMATDIMSCLMGSLGSLTGDSEGDNDIRLAVVEDDEATNSIITCVLDAIGGASGDTAETPEGETAK